MGVEGVSIYFKSIVCGSVTTEFGYKYCSPGWGGRVQPVNNGLAFYFIAQSFPGVERADVESDGYGSSSVLCELAGLGLEVRANFGLPMR